MYVGWCGSKNRDHNNMCLKDIGLQAQNKIILLSSIVKVIEGEMGT